MSPVFSKLCSCTSVRSNSVSNAAGLKNLLPDSYDYNVCEYEQEDGGFICRFRINIKSKEEALQWLEEFSFLSKTTYRSERVYPQDSVKIIYKVSKCCHHKTKSSVIQQSKSKRNTNCPARIAITVKQTSLSRKYKSKDIHLQEFPTIVLLYYTHNHPLNSADVLKFRIPHSEVKKEYIKLFMAGYTPSKAYHVFNSELQEKYMDQYHTIASDRALNPDIRWVYHAYYGILKEHGIPTCKSKLKSLDEFVKKDSEDVSDSSTSDISIANNHTSADMNDEWFEPIQTASKTMNDTLFFDSIFTEEKLQKSNETHEELSHRTFEKMESSEETVKKSTDKASKLIVSSYENVELVHENDKKITKSSDTNQMLQKLDNAFKSIMNTVKSNPEMYDSAEKFIENAKNIKTNAELGSALATFGKYNGIHYKSKVCLSSIKNVATAIAQREAHLPENSNLKRTSISILLPERNTRKYRKIAPRISAYSTTEDISLRKRH